MVAAIAAKVDSTSAGETGERRTNACLALKLSRLVDSVTMVVPTGARAVVSVAGTRSIATWRAQTTATCHRPRPGFLSEVWVLVALFGFSSNYFWNLSHFHPNRLRMCYLRVLSEFQGLGGKLKS